ncbi:hypothetical protein CFOL_v3_16817 [Cephalotus follicularis]|uniref:Uncharacterized protein n=1 Tax=Cephalotus follicularis TaxID=3775 RepID=A0A1Q3BZL2_CEPFO|nr:hypothetical protein CFOL_v3_16817 [Cephalotus follicularis]
MVFWERYMSDAALNTKKEEHAKNLVLLSTVIKCVLLQQLIQVAIAQLFLLVSYFYKYNLLLLLLLLLLLRRKNSYIK